MRLFVYLINLQANMPNYKLMYNYNFMKISAMFQRWSKTYFNLVSWTMHGKNYSLRTQVIPSYTPLLNLSFHLPWVNFLFFSEDCHKHVRFIWLTQHNYFPATYNFKCFRQGTTVQQNFLFLTFSSNFLIPWFQNDIGNHDRRYSFPRVVGFESLLPAVVVDQSGMLESLW